MSWLEFLHPFNAVQILHARGSPPQYRLSIHIARVLGELAGERAVEVLPMLHTLELNRHMVTPMLKSFIDARQSLGHPVVIID